MISTQLRLPSFLAALFVAVCTFLAPSPARAGEHLKVIVPEKDNLQYLAFWYAKAGGAFEREDIELEIVVAPPPGPKGTPPIEGQLESGEVDAALAGPPVYLRMIAAKAPVVVVANLFKNDPYALLVRREAADAHKLSADAPIHDRIVSLRGMTIAYPPAAFGRLRALLASQGLDIDKDVKATVILARQQSAAFKDPSIEAAYLATPALEKNATADVVVLVDQARSEVPELANRQTNVLLVSHRVWESRRDAVTAMVRALANAEKQLHAAPAEVVVALAREFPSRDRGELETAVRLYEPGIPDTPDVHAEDFGPALALIPESVPKPELAGVDLAPFVAKELGVTAMAATNGAARRTLWLSIGVGAGVVVAIVLALRLRRQRRAVPPPP